MRIQCECNKQRHMRFGLALEKGHQVVKIHDLSITITITELRRIRQHSWPLIYTPESSAINPLPSCHAFQAAHVFFNSQPPSSQVPPI